MTIKQLHDITGRSTTIFMAWDGSIYELDRENNLVIGAYGKFIVSQVNAMSESAIEIVIKTIPATI